MISLRNLLYIAALFFGTEKFSQNCSRRVLVSPIGALMFYKIMNKTFENIIKIFWHYFYEV